MPVPLHMGWRHVLFGNWWIEPAIVQRRLPPALTVDTFDGRAWLSAVPFTNVDVRPWTLPSGWGLRLPELNLRTYVRHDEVPGIYFFSLDTEGLLAVVGARLFHHLPYYYARVSLSERDGRIRFSATRCHPGAEDVAFEATYEPVGRPTRATSGSLADFLVSRDRYYTETLAGRIRYAEVHHAPWPLQEVEVEADADGLFIGNDFDPPQTTPVWYYSHGVDVLASVNRAVDAEVSGWGRPDR